MDDAALLEALRASPRATAGAEILKLVAAGFEVETKSDQSPVTVCDRAAEAIILAALAAAAPGVPVIAEEEVAAGRIPAHGDTYFLVDPLDGTKEFVRGGDDYTVNIGLIVDGAPRLGVVYQPAHRPAVRRAGRRRARWLEEDGARARRSRTRALGRSARRGRVQVALQPGDRRLSRRRRSARATMSRSARASNSASSPRAAPTSTRACRRPASGTRPPAMPCCSPPAGGSTGPTARRWPMARPPSSTAASAPPRAGRRRAIAPFLGRIRRRRRPARKESERIIRSDPDRRYPLPARRRRAAARRLRAQRGDLRAQARVVSTPPSPARAQRRRQAARLGRARSASSASQRARWTACADGDSHWQLGIGRYA